MKPPRHLVKVTLHSLIPWQYCKSEMEDACLVRLSAYDVLQLLVVTSTHRHSHFVDWIHVRCSSEGATSFPFSHSYNVACARWSIFSARAGPSCGVFFSFDVILEVISSFLSPGPLSYSTIPQSKQGASSMEDCLNLHWSNMGLQLGHWRVGRAFGHQGRLTTCCLLGCHFSTSSRCWLCYYCAHFRTKYIYIFLHTCIYKI